MKRCFLLLLILLCFSLLFVACDEPTETSDSAAASSDLQDSQDSEAGTSEESTAETTTEAPSLENDIYAQAGLALAQQTCANYYDLRTHRLVTSLTDRGDAVIWGVASYIEMLADAYRAYPDDPVIQRYYLDVLNQCLPRYKVSDATINAPGGIFEHISYYNAGKGGKGDFYYDDNAWIGLQLFNAYELLGDKKYLDLAEEVLAFLWTGWDMRGGGGIYWDKTFGGKGTCTNGPAGLCFSLGYLATQNETYLEHAKDIYDFEYKILRDERGLYAEGLEGDWHSKKPWRAAYDQGTMVASAAMLYAITEDEAYFTSMKQTAAACTTLLFKNMGSGKYVMNNNPIFKSWCVGWAVRGEMLAAKYGANNLSKSFFSRLSQVLDETLKTKDENGQYDPYFCSGTGEGNWWTDPNSFDTDILQPCGVAIVLVMTGLYRVNLSALPSK